MKVTRIFLFSHCCLCFVPTYDLFLLPTSCCDHCHYLCDSINFPSQRLKLIGYAICCLFYLNGFHVAMLPFSNRLQMMSNCVKNKKKKWHTRGQPSVTHVLTPFWHHLQSITVHTGGKLEFTWFTWLKSKMLLKVRSSIGLSSDKSWVGTNQNSCIIWLNYLTLDWQWVEWIP